MKERESCSWGENKGGASTMLYVTHICTRLIRMLTVTKDRLKTSTSTLGAATPTAVWIWLVWNLLTLDGEMLPPLLHLLSKVSGKSMLALAGPMASTSSWSVSPPLAPLVLRRRGSSLASVCATVLMFRCPLGRLLFVVMRGVAAHLASRQLPTFFRDMTCYCYCRCYYYCHWYC